MTGRRLRIRRAERADAALVLDFIVRLAEFERLAAEVTATQADIEATLFGPDPRVFCEIAEQDGAPVGFALWFYSYSTFQGQHGIWLEDLYVTPHVRGLGVGKALLSCLARRCEAEGLGRLGWSVLDWNESAIRFYEAQGAAIRGGWATFVMSGRELTTLARR